MDRIIEETGGFELWRTRDGSRWVPVTRNGFGNVFNYGVRSMVSRPCGLFVGAANPFGPEVAVQKDGGWTYEHNPRGGLEIWLGSWGSPSSTSLLGPTQETPAGATTPVPDD
jgi:hypothetical protein